MGEAGADGLLEEGKRQGREGGGVLQGRRGGVVPLRRAGRQSPFWRPASGVPLPHCGTGVGADVVTMTAVGAGAAR